MGWIFYKGVPIKNFKTSDDDMKYAPQTIDLSAGVEYDLTTTLTSSRVIYNVQIEYPSGTDITETILRRWAVSGDYWHVYLTSSESLSNVIIKIIY